MNKDGNTIKFKEINSNPKNISSKPQNQRDVYKLGLVKKYGVSLDEAEKILTQLEKNHVGSKKSVNASQINKSNNGQNQKNLKYFDSSIKQDFNGNKKEDIIAQKQVSKKDTDKFIEKFENESHSNLQNKIKYQQDGGNVEKEEFLNGKNNTVDANNKDNVVKTQITRNDSVQNQINKPNSSIKHSSQKNSFSEKNVDNILDEIIPDYNKQISIKLDHVDLTFEVQNEKVDTLKESFIRVLKRNQPNKVKIHALKDVSFQIYKGEKVGVIGYNGAGKSTLLNVITGIYPPDKGSVVTQGNISPLLSLGAGFDHNFSGRKNIFLNGAVLGYSKKFLESKVDEIIEFSELGDFIDIPIKNYSSGMLAKLGFSIATSVNPDILIIDEILGVGDITFAKKSADKLKSLMDGGTTVILVSHSIPQIRQLCDKAIWVDNGCVRDIGEVNKVCDAYLKDAENASNKQLANIQFR